LKICSENIKRWRTSIAMMIGDKRNPLDKDAQNIETKWTALNTKVLDYKGLLDELIVFYKQLDDFKVWMDRKFELIKDFKQRRDDFVSGKSEDMGEIDFVLAEIKRNFDDNNDARDKLNKLSEKAFRVNGKKFKNRETKTPV
jgi:hypothetical protein